LPSAGQAAPEPVQFSAVSQIPADARQSVLEDWNPSAGHVALEPVQFSTASQMPAEPRQIVLEERNWQVELQHTPGGSHCSALKFVSVWPSPHDDV
jgi:hypothetical protein